MNRLLTTFACLLCLVLNASTIEIGQEKSGFLDVRAVDQVNLLDSQENSSLYLAKGFKLPRIGSPKPIPKPKSPPPKQQPKNGGKEAPKGSQETNQRESNREKHENADARRQREQAKAEEKRESNKKNK